MSVIYCGVMSVVMFGRHVLWGYLTPKTCLGKSNTRTCCTHCQRTTDRKLTTGHWITSITSFWFKPILKVTPSIPSVFWTIYTSVPINVFLLFGTQRVPQSLTRTERLLAITQYWTRATVLATHLCSVRAQCSRTKSCGRCLVAG